MAERRRFLVPGAAAVAAAVLSYVALRPPARVEVASGAAAVAAMAFDAPVEVVRLGTPLGELAEVHGFDRVRFEPGRETAVLGRRRAELRFRWQGVAPRVALIDLEVPRDPPYGALRVLLNGFRVARLELETGRRRHLVSLPEGRQEAGLNKLSLVFGRPAEDETVTGADAVPSLPGGRLFGVVVAPPGAFAAALAESRLPFSAWAEGRDVVQAGTSALSWAVVLPPRAQLRFRPAVHGPRAEATLFRVEMELETGGRRDLWSGRAAERPVTLDVPGPAGEPVRLVFHVGSAEDRPVWGAWRDLALLGRPAPAAAVATAAVDEALSRLAGTSVIVISLDAAGAGHFGAYGYPRATTPEIDRLAAEGVLFERHYTPAPFTRAAVASLWTSQVPDEHHAGVSHEAPLPEHVPVLAEKVAGADAVTAAFVANPMAGIPLGLHRGFREFFPVGLRASAYRDDLFAWLERHARERFFLYVHHREPHFPFDPLPPYDTIFGPDAPLPASVKTDSTWMDLVNAGTHQPTAAELDHLVRMYDGGLRAVDAEIGLMRAHLERLGLWDRTVVIVTADHGEAFFEHGFLGHNEQLYEESVRIPLVVRFPPGVVPPGQRVRALTDLLDVAPTVAEIFGLRGAATGGTFRGQSLLPLALGGDGAREEILIRAAGPRPLYAWVSGRYKYLYDSRDGEEELYDLAEDPSERHDLTGQHPVRVESARQSFFRRLITLPRADPSGRALDITPEQREQLRALGYVE